MTTLSIPELDTPFIFESRPEAIPGDFRPLWRIGTLLLILLVASRGGKSSLVRLHVLNWAIRTPQNRQNLKNVILGKIKTEAVLVRIEPSLNRAVDLAQGEGLVCRDASSHICLTPRGKSTAETICGEPSVFAEERTFLMEIGKKVTEKLVQHLFTARN